MKIKNNKAALYAKSAAAANGNEKAIVESWSPMIQKVTGVTDPEKLSWMS
jgi:hypothetical protein